MVRPHIGVCLCCLGCPRAKGHPTAVRSSTPSSQVRNQQLHGQITRYCYIQARKSEEDESWTPKTTDPPKNALQNQQRPCRHQPGKLLPPLRPWHQRSTKTATRTDPAPCPLSVLFPRTVSEWNPLLTSISSAPSLESFQSRRGRSLHNLQPVPTSPLTSRSCIEFLRQQHLFFIV